MLLSHVQIDRAICDLNKLKGRLYHTARNHLDSNIELDLDLAAMEPCLAALEQSCDHEIPTEQTLLEREFLNGPDQHLGTISFTDITPLVDQSGTTPALAAAPPAPLLRIHVQFEPSRTSSLQARAVAQLTQSVSNPSRLFGQPNIRLTTRHDEATRVALRSLARRSKGYLVASLPDPAAPP